MTDTPEGEAQRVHVLIGSWSHGDSQVIGVYTTEEAAKAAQQKLEESGKASGGMPSDKTALPDDHDWPDNLVSEHDGRDHPKSYDYYKIQPKEVYDG